MTENEQRDHAFGDLLKAAEKYLLVWRRVLSPELEAKYELPKYEKLDWRLGVAISAPRDRVTLQVFLLNQETNETKVLEAVEQSAGSLAVN